MYCGNRMLTEAGLQLVYEPHIAPKFEEWAESFLEKRRQRQRNRQRTGSVLAHSHPFEGSENGARRSADSGQDRRDDEDNNDTAIELEQLAARERDAWRREAASSGLRQRRPVGAMDDVSRCGSLANDSTLTCGSPVQPLHPIPCYEPDSCLV